MAKQELYTIEQLRRGLRSSFTSMAFDEFVLTVLEHKPNHSDPWQTEKFQMFLDTCDKLLRMNPEHLERVITLGLARSSYAQPAP